MIAYIIAVMILCMLKTHFSDLSNAAQQDISDRIISAVGSHLVCIFVLDIETSYSCVAIQYAGRLKYKHVNKCNQPLVQVQDKKNQ